MTAAHTRILELRAELDQHNYSYHVRNGIPRLR